MAIDLSLMRARRVVCACVRACGIPSALAVRRALGDRAAMSFRPPSTRPTSRPATVQTSNSFTQSTRTQSRPLTAQSRPFTAQSARPGTAVSSRHEGSFIVAVLEGRGVGREVGIAALDKETGQVNLIQVRYWLRRLPTATDRYFSTEKARRPTNVH